MTQIIYSGIGSRETPTNVLADMVELAKMLGKLNACLRSGGAPGADTAFEQGCVAVKGQMEIFLPWRGFNGNRSHLYDIHPKAFVVAEKFHPGWRHLKEPVRRLMARNVQQVLGKNLDSPVDFVLCWTPDGCEDHSSRTRKTGGTGQAISIASSCDIPVINLFNADALDRIEQILQRMKAVPNE